MSGITTYHESNRITSTMCGYGIRQSGVQTFLTSAQVAAANTVEDLVANVNAAVVHASLEPQRIAIVNSLREGARLGDLSDARIQAANTVTDLANDTWVSDDAAADHLGVNVTG